MVLLLIKISVNEHMDITHVHDFSQNFWDYIFFKDLEITIFKFHDFSRFSV